MTTKKLGRPDERTVKVSVSLRRETRDRVARYAREHGIPFSRALDLLLARLRSI